MGVIDPSRANVARVHDCLLGFNNSYASDRALAKVVQESSPAVGDIVRHNAYFATRAVRALAGACGIEQFLDLGVGLPQMENTHVVAQRERKDARVLYVDNDALVLLHGRAWLQDRDTVWMLDADITQPHTILEHETTRGLIDFSRPVAVLLSSVLHFFDGDTPWLIIEALRKAMTPGSYLVISHAVLSPQTAEAARLYRKETGVGTPRERAEILRMFDGFELVDPGLVPVSEWRPELTPEASPRELPFVGGIGRLPIAGR